MKMSTPPIGNVPSNYFRAMDPTKIGAVKSLSVASLHNGDAIFFRLDWDDPTQDLAMSEPGKFRDGAGILFPFKDTARIANMGSKNEPVNAWCWQAGIETPLNVTAAGLGTTRREGKSYCLAKPVWADGHWAVVMARPFKVPEPELNVALAPGMTKQVGFAVWEGSNAERAGAKSFCGEWFVVEIAP
jgi:DMSO reductase family type II enzyme heme b subunit